MARVRPGRTIDFKQWTFIPGGSFDFTAAGTTGGPGSLGFTQPGTILRIRGLVRVAFLVTGITADDEANVVFGIALVSTDAAASSTSLPDPSQEPEYPWLWYGEAIMYSPNQDFSDPMIQLELPIDSKAMRKFKPGQSLIPVAQYVDTQGTPGLRVIYSQIRVLIGT